MTEKMICPHSSDRLSPALRDRLQERQPVLFDLHCHLFHKDHIPDHFLRLKVPMKDRVLGKMEQFLHGIVNRTDTDKWSNLAYFVNLTRSVSMEETALKLFRYYDNHVLFGPHTVICPMMMDFQPRPGEGVRGKLQKSYSQQVEDMADLRDRYPDRILPFLAIDPRRPGVFEEMFLPAFASGKFFGIKLYPSLGYLPSHPELLKIYRVCEEKNIPVTVHCGTGAVRSSRFHLKDIPGLRYTLSNPEGPAEETTESRWLFTGKAFAEYFNHPRNWQPVLERFPRLRLNLAHFGSVVEWKKYLAGQDNTWPARIIDLIYRYPHVYTDISYNISARDQHRALRELLERNPRLRERTLFGSDYYMVVKAGHFRTILADFTAAVGEDLLHSLADDNARTFLGL